MLTIYFSALLDLYGKVVGPVKHANRQSIR